MAMALILKEEAVFCSNMMLELASIRDLAACRCISITHRRCTSPATVPTFLAQTYRAEILFFRARTGGARIS